MPIPQYNATANYRVGTVYDYSKDERAKVAALLKSQDVYISDKTSFRTIWFDLSQRYILPHVTTTSVARAWNNNPIQFWQTQVQFAFGCATTGCGVSVRDHLLNETLPPLVRSLFIFHIYYQTRRILAEMKCPLPTRDDWNALDNKFDHHAFQAICGEFGLDPNQIVLAYRLGWKHMASNGLGNVNIEWNRNDSHYWITYGNYDPNHNKFDGALDSSGGRLNYISQDTDPTIPADITNGFVWSMLDKSQGFTRAGVERINDSVRTYAWAILGAQGQTRTSILGVGPAFDCPEAVRSQRGSEHLFHGRRPSEEYLTVSRRLTVCEI